MYLFVGTAVDLWVKWDVDEGCNVFYCGNDLCDLESAELSDEFVENRVEIEWIVEERCGFHCKSFVVIQKYSFWLLFPP